MSDWNKLKSWGVMPNKKPKGTLTQMDYNGDIQKPSLAIHIDFNTIGKNDLLMEVAITIIFKIRFTPQSKLITYTWWHPFKFELNNKAFVTSQKIDDELFYYLLGPIQYAISSATKEYDNYGIVVRRESGETIKLPFLNPTVDEIRQILEPAIFQKPNQN